ncbi:putative ATX1-antioxidant protein and metal homeostasis factor [Catenaria anguillulae PL171]|uniref:Putative ATX1-antioxidant protein and metal homeostasis factor n=1 Tax=Catenaria anguillulae PL171 TaxID=765915 RepID=A0A1Y2I3F6_9FUNG|nr:putative ATX1-antioxidant protein and metal homeostasis factor [Catenaria anguillulae PL171]
MTCSGCSGAVERALNRLGGISNLEVSLEKQTVVVETDHPKDVIFETIKKTGKAVTEA